MDTAQYSRANKSVLSFVALRGELGGNFVGLCRLATGRGSSNSRPIRNKQCSPAGNATVFRGKEMDRCESKATNRSLMMMES
jgi:ssDNA-binding Zn-finger/Zn-ribbon topoisomerase 1